jgi:hypothetical protein
VACDWSTEQELLMAFRVAVTLQTRNSTDKTWSFVSQRAPLLQAAIRCKLGNWRTLSLSWVLCPAVSCEVSCQYMGYLLGYGYLWAGGSGVGQCICIMHMHMARHVL